MVHSKRIGQPILMQTTTRREEKKVAIMISGFQQAASFSTSGYAIDIPSGAKGLMIDDYSACFNNEGANAGVYGSKGKINFCFYDTNRDEYFDKAMLDSFNSWGKFDIATTRYRVEDVIVGAGEVLRRRELVYRGEGVVEFREFSMGDTVVPKIVETIQFSTSKEGRPTIRYKGAALHVISATNEAIRFQIVSHFESQ